jgi:hypothetical protein
MCEEPETVVVEFRKRSMPFDMVCWCSGTSAVTLQCVQTPIAEPLLFPVAVVDSSKQHVLMIAHKTDGAISLRVLQCHRILDDAAATPR